MVWVVKPRPPAATVRETRGHLVSPIINPGLSFIRHLEIRPLCNVTLTENKLEKKGKMGQKHENEAQTTVNIILFESETVLEIKAEN